MTTQLLQKTAHSVQLTHARFEHTAPRPQRGASDAEVVRLHFSLQGQYAVDYPTLGRRYGRLGPHWSMFYARPFSVEAVAQSPVLETFGLQFPVAHFVEYVGNADTRVARFCDRILAGQAGFLSEPSASLPAPLELAVRRMLACRYDGALEQLYVFSQSLELLATTIALGVEPTPLKRDDRDRLQAARTLIDARLCDPPGLSTIAEAVGLNEYKLKRGFKQLFGTSVIAYLTRQRLELGRRMLLDTDKTAAEVGFELGYATPQHFNQAFKKHFGCTPKVMRKAP
ncbi:MAG: AraC family transcriptional regulator [Polyangiales bacterium]